MAQELPRYCPQCGTPTRAEMEHCATCGLPRAAMLRRSDDPSVADDADQAGTLQEAIAPTPRQRQAGRETLFSAIPARPQISRTNQQVPQEAEQLPFPPPTAGPDKEEDIADMPTRSETGVGVWDLPTQMVPRQAAPVPSTRPAGSPAASPEEDEPTLTYSPAPAPAPASPLPQAPWSAPVAPPPSSALAPRQRGRRRSGIIFLVLVILLLLIGGGYFALAALGVHLPGLNTPQAPIKTSALNGTFTYAGADITLLNVQQARNFVDDPQTAGDGMLRLNLQEHNPTTVPIGWDYQQNARLIVGGKQILTPTYIKTTGNLVPGATRKNVLDFTVANGGNLQNIVFQLGTSKEARISIPLNGQANFSQYQAKTITRHAALVYFGLDWTLTGTTTGLSIPGQQASSGMEFLTVNLVIDNTLSQQAISGSPYDYLRVKVGGQTIAPVSTTIPVSFASGEKNRAGTATFLIPQNSTTCTLLFLSQDPDGKGQAAVHFQVG